MRLLMFLPTFLHYIQILLIVSSNLCFLFISCGYQFALSLFSLFCAIPLSAKNNFYGSFSYSSLKSFLKVPNYEQLSLLWALHTQLQNNSSSQFYWWMLIGLIWITMRFTIMHNNRDSFIFHIVRCVRRSYEEEIIAMKKESELIK